MMINKISILYVEDNEDDFLIIRDILGQSLTGKFKLNWAPRLEKAREFLSTPQEKVDIILLDLGLNECQGVETYERIQAEASGLPVIILTANKDINLALKIVERGAQDYLLKDELQGEMLSRFISYAIERSRFVNKLESANNRLKETIQQLEEEMKNRQLAEQQLKSKQKQLEESKEETQRTLNDLKISHGQLKETQGRLIQSEKLASVGQLAAGIAHEINNPIAFIHNNLDVMKRYLGDMLEFIKKVQILKEAVKDQNMDAVQSAVRELELMQQKIRLEFILEDIRNLLDESFSGTKRIRKIVADLRTFSYKGDDSRELTDLKEVVKKVINLAKNEIKYKCAVKEEYGDVPPVECNPQKIGQVLLNLILNASQAIEENGIITVRTYETEDYVCLDIEDNGKGIPSDMLTKIFEPFYTTKPVGQGTGLGLSISAEIVKQHKGEIKVSSQLGKGTTFSLCLPKT